jgi:hypothetical protein
MAKAIIPPKFYAFDRDGKPLAFGKVFTYQARTNTPKLTYNDEGQLTPNANPVILNGEGYGDIYLDGSYKIVLTDKNGAEIWTSDSVSQSSGSSSQDKFTLTATYISPTSITVLGDHTKSYVSGLYATLKMLNGTAASEVNTTVLSVAYNSGDNKTTIVFTDAVVTTYIKTVGVSNWPFEAIKTINEYVDFLKVYAETTAATAISPEAKTYKTINQFNTEFAAAIRAAGGAPLGDGQYSGLKTYTAYNQYLIQSGTPFKPLSIPYTINTATYPNAINDPNLQPFSEVTTLKAVAIANDVAVGDVAFLSVGSSASVKILYSHEMDKSYRVLAPINGLITAVGTEEFNCVTITVNGVSHLITPVPVKNEIKASQLTAAGGNLPPSLILSEIIKHYHLNIDIDCIFTETTVCSGSDFSGMKIRFTNSSRVLPVPTATRTNWILIQGSETATSAAIDSNSSAGDNFITCASLSSTLKKGDTILIKSDDFVPGGDYLASGIQNRIGEIATITDIVGNNIYFDFTLTYNMLTASNSKVVLLDMIDGVSIHDAKINKLDFASLTAIGINIKYAKNVSLFNPEVVAGKQPLEDETAGSITYEGINAVSISNSINVKIYWPTMKQIGWYGIGIVGACRKIRIYDGDMYDCRHGVDVTWTNGYGAPDDVKVIRTKANKCSLSGLGTHTVGTNISFIDCESNHSARDSGFHIRSANVTLVRPKAHYNNLDGIIARESGIDLVINDPDCMYNNRNGINTTGGSHIYNGRSKFNGSATVGGVDIATNGGGIFGVEISKYNLGSDNYPIRCYSIETLLNIGQKRLVVDGVRVDRSANSLTGGRFMFADSGFDYSLVEVKNCYIPDFIQGSQTFIYEGGVIGGAAPITNNNILFSSYSDAKRRVNLSSGSVIVTGIKLGSRFTYPYYTPKIKVRKVGNALAHDGALSVRFIDYTSFKIASTNGAETSLVEWEICD